LNSVDRFRKFLKTVDLDGYREKYKPIKIVEMNMPPNTQAIAKIYEIYWVNKDFINFNEFYVQYLDELKDNIEEFRIKTTMCEDCFYRGLPARIYRTWASLITQIHAGYVAESVFGDDTVSMSEELDHKGADFQVIYKGHTLNYQVKKESESDEIRRARAVKNKIPGEFIDIVYKVPTADIFENPYTKKGKLRKPYTDFMANKNLERFDNGFVVFTPKIFEDKKAEIDASLQ